MQIFAWQTNSVRGSTSSLGRRGVFLVEEHNSRHWAWPERTTPIPFEDNIQWAHSQISFGQHATPNWALLGPSEKGRNSVALEELDSQPEKDLSQSTHVGKNNTDSTHGPSLNANVAFGRMGVKREAESSWRFLKEGKKPKVLKGEGLVAEVKSGRIKQRRFTKSPKARMTTSRGQVPQVIEFSEEGLREVAVVLAPTLELRDSHVEVTSAAETGGGGWPKTATRAP
ncbi:unnamed protein product [Prunus armeniaca]|uniref:Uncharacterized protein n=1 Tax=Prunus armeniaca TaxID=36596 RepID=A0A6J5VC90_PRUAR|nr:unnamed protein product [Prunus armeniaca]